jgi:hypothetical protein
LNGVWFLHCSLIEMLIIPWSKQKGNLILKFCLAFSPMEAI